jgi:hypothetical protein
MSISKLYSHMILQIMPAPTNNDFVIIIVAYLVARHAFAVKHTVPSCGDTGTCA